MLCPGTVVLPFPVKDNANLNRELPEPIARVNDHYLYISDIEGMISTDASPEDSASMMNAYVNNWIRKQLLIDDASSKTNKTFKVGSSFGSDLKICLIKFATKISISFGSNLFKLKI